MQFIFGIFVSRTGAFELRLRENCLLHNVFSFGQISPALGIDIHC